MVNTLYNPEFSHDNESYGNINPIEYMELKDYLFLCEIKPQRSMI